MRKTASAALVGILVLVSAWAAHAQSPSAPDMKIVMAAGAEGARTWGGVCSGCHAPPDQRGPDRIALSQRSADDIYLALTTGKMKSIGDTMTESERRNISMYLTGKPLSATVPPSMDAAAPARSAPAPEPAPPG